MSDAYACKLSLDSAHPQFSQSAFSVSPVTGNIAVATTAGLFVFEPEYQDIQTTDSSNWVERAYGTGSVKRRQIDDGLYRAVSWHPQPEHCSLILALTANGEEIVLIDTLRGAQKPFRSKSRFTCFAWAQDSKEHSLCFLTGNVSGTIQQWDTCSDQPLKEVNLALSSSPLLAVSADSKFMVDSAGRVGCFSSNGKPAVILDDGVLGPCCLVGDQDYVFVSKMDRVYSFHRSSLQYTQPPPDGSTIVSVLALGRAQGIVAVTASGAVLQLGRDAAGCSHISVEGAMSEYSSAIASGPASDHEPDEGDAQDEDQGPGSEACVETLSAQLIGGAAAVALLQVTRHEANVEKAWIKFVHLCPEADRKSAPIYSLLSVCCREFQAAILRNDPAVSTHPEWSHFASGTQFSANCALCNVTVPLAASQTACPNGHPFSVCSKSGKVIASLNMFRCRICNRSVATSEQPEGSCCFWCQGPLMRVDQ